MNTKTTKFLQEKSLKNRIQSFQDHLNTVDINDLVAICKQHNRDFYFFCLDINNAFVNGIVLKEHPYFDYLSLIKICFTIEDTKFNFDKYFPNLWNYVLDCLHPNMKIEIRKNAFELLLLYIKNNTTSNVKFLRKQFVNSFKFEAY